ncbi:MAG: amidoligase family protein [Candidatus Hodarchaeales archaeon]|jgi:hypothetical protein
MKYFTHSYLNDYNILGKARIGLEFEFLSKVNYHSTILFLSEKLGIKVNGIKTYHSDFVPTETEWKLEPDLSGGFSCAELITNPMPYSEARVMLSKVCAILQEIAETNDRTGIHINISFDSNDINIESINPIKLILNIDEEKIYEDFPDRRNNVYCKSVKSILPYKGYDFSTANSKILSSSLSLTGESNKYYGINFTCLTDGRIEFRYIGGEDYQYKTAEILELMDYFITSSYNALHSNLNGAEQKMLRRYLEVNIEKYKSLSKLESFLTKYPTVNIEVDKNNSFEVIKSYYPTFYDELFDLVSFTKGLEECTINFDTDSRQLEVIDADIDCVSLLTDMVFVDCNLSGGDFSKCEFYSSNIKNAIVNVSTISDTVLTDSKLLECKVVNDSELIECYFSEGVMDGVMNGGIFRSGQIGQNSVISKETKMLNSEDNFFNFKGVRGSSDDIEFDKKKKK